MSKRRSAAPRIVAERPAADPSRTVQAARRGERDWYRIVDLDGGVELQIYDAIGGWGVTAEEFVADLAEVTAPELTVRINSPGGEVFDATVIYNALMDHPAQVTCVVDGIAASAASVIAQAGDRVVMNRASQMMIHDASGLCIGNADDMLEMADLLDKLSGEIAGIYAARAGGDVAGWRARMRAETWMTGPEAVDLGLADEVVATPQRGGTPDGKGGDEPAPVPPAAQDRTPAVHAEWDLTVFRYAGRDAAPTPVPVAQVDVEPVAMACPVHHTATVDTPWDGGAAERRLPSPMSVATAKAVYGWYDSAQVDAGKLVKAACKLPHHEVSADGTPGAANLAGVRNALSRLPQSDIPAGEQDAVRRHLQAHLDDAPAHNHVEPPAPEPEPVDPWAELTAPLLSDPWAELLGRLTNA